MEIEVEKIEQKADEWTNKWMPNIYKKLDEAQIVYNDEVLCHISSDAFLAGYLTAIKELKEASDEQEEKQDDI